MNIKCIILNYVLFSSFFLHANILDESYKIGQHYSYLNETYIIVGIKTIEEHDYSALVLDLEKPITFLGIEFASKEITLIFKKSIWNNKEIHTCTRKKNIRLAHKTYALAILFFINSR